MNYRSAGKEKPVEKESAGSAHRSLDDLPWLQRNPVNGFPPQTEKSALPSGPAKIRWIAPLHSTCANGMVGDTPELRPQNHASAANVRDVMRSIMPESARNTKGMRLISATAWLVLFAAAVGIGSIPSRAWLIQGSSTYVGPGDLNAFTAWYGLRGYSRAKALAGNTKMMKLRRPSSGETCDVLVAVTGGQGLTTGCSGASDGQSVTTFCGGVDCRVQIWYDQTGNNACAASSCDIIQNTTGNQPALAFASGFDYVRFDAASMLLNSANNFTPSAAKLSVVGVANRTIGSAGTRVLYNVGSGNGLATGNSATNVWHLWGSGSAAFSAAAADSVWHAGIAIINGASSILTIDGSDTTGTATASTSAAAPSSGTTPSGVAQRSREGGFIDNYALSSGERTSLDSNMRNYWGF